MMSFTLLPAAGQFLHFTVTVVIMRMFLELTDQVSFLIVASILRGMLMLLQLTLQLSRQGIAAVIVMMALALLLTAGKHILITFIAVLMLIYPA